MKKKIMIIAGEASGDMHGSALIREMRKQNSELEIFGIGGENMKQQGVELLYHIHQMHVLGFGDVIKRFPFFRKVFSRLVSTLKNRMPDLLILIDYPGMNLKLAKAAKKLGIKVFYYIAPQVWAWGSGRIQKMKTLVDKLAVILPFEEPLFQQASIDVEYVGHPLMEASSPQMPREEFYQINQLQSDKKIIGLLPGSRVLEVKRLLPNMIKTVDMIGNVQVIVSRAATVDTSIYNEILNGDSSLKLLENSTAEIMKYSDLLIVASGTATLESALFGTPLIIVYKVDPLSYFIGKRLIKIKNIGLVNVISNRQIVPEFIQHHFTPNNLQPAIHKLLYDTAEREQVIENLIKIRKTLGEKSASVNAARIALSLLNNQNH